MDPFPPQSQEHSQEVLSLFRSTFRERIKALQKDTIRVKIPEETHLYERSPNMTYHFKPELFIQTGGATYFNFPEEEFRLQAPDICVMPQGVPHAEKTENYQSTFENIVVCFYSKTVTIHLARENDLGLPAATDVFFFQTPHFGNLIRMLKLSSELHHSALSDSHTGRNALLVAILTVLLNMLTSEDEAATPDSQRIYQCQWLIRNHLNNPDLSVQWLADKLDCTANYLSRSFQDEMGEKLTNYITRVRLLNALSALRETTLSVKEISNACGFRDPNYFSRIFKNRFDQSPKEYRQSLVQEPQEVEEQPKLVRGDYEEFHYGFDLYNRPITRKLASSHATPKSRL